MDPDYSMECEICQKKCSNQRGLTIHQLRLHVTKTVFKCDVCQRITKSQGELNKHMRCHNTVKPFECGSCQKKFKTKGNLIDHFRVHSWERPFQCDVCHYKYKSKSELSRHRKDLHPDREREVFFCDICQSKFTRKDSVVNHFNRVHSEEKTLACDICPKKFATRSILKDHKLTHRQYECKDCQQKFSSRRGYNSHFSRPQHDKCHREELECSFCQKEFRSVLRLSRHVRMHTNEVHDCTICMKVFVSKVELKKHGVVHEKAEGSNCNTCFEEFDSQVELKEHSKNCSQEKTLETTEDEFISHCLKIEREDIHGEELERKVKMEGDIPSDETNFENISVKSECEIEFNQMKSENFGPVIKIEKKIEVGSDDSV